MCACMCVCTLRLITLITVGHIPANHSASASYYPYPQLSPYLYPYPYACKRKLFAAARHWQCEGPGVRKGLFRFFGMAYYSRQLLSTHTDICECCMHDMLCTTIYGQLCTQRNCLAIWYIIHKLLL